MAWVLGLLLCWADSGISEWFRLGGAGADLFGRDDGVEIWVDRGVGGAVCLVLCYWDRMLTALYLRVWPYPSVGFAVVWN